MLCGFAFIPNGPLRITKSDHGKTIEIKRGRSIDIVLEGNPTTGYMWGAVSKKSPVLQQLKEREYRSRSKLIGSGGEFTFHYKAVKTGKAELKFAYQRSWEKRAPAGTLDVKITVK